MASSCGSLTFEDFPEQAYDVFVGLFSKPGGGRRHIGFYRSIFRPWGKQNGPEINKREAFQPGPRTIRRRCSLPPECESRESREQDQRCLDVALRLEEVLRTYQALQTCRRVSAPTTPNGNAGSVHAMVPMEPHRCDGGHAWQGGAPHIGEVTETPLLPTS